MAETREVLFVCRHNDVSNGLSNLFVRERPTPFDLQSSCIGMQVNRWHKVRLSHVPDNDTPPRAQSESTIVFDFTVGPSAIRLNSESASS